MDSMITGGDRERVHKTQRDFEGCCKSGYTEVLRGEVGGRKEVTRKQARCHTGAILSSCPSFSMIKGSGSRVYTQGSV